MANKVPTKMADMKYVSGSGFVVKMTDTVAMR